MKILVNNKQNFYSLINNQGGVIMESDSFSSSSNTYRGARSFRNALLNKQIVGDPNFADIEVKNKSGYVLARKDYSTVGNMKRGFNTIKSNVTKIQRRVEPLEIAN